MWERCMCQCPQWTWHYLGWWPEIQFGWWFLITCGLSLHACLRTTWMPAVRGPQDGVWHSGTGWLWAALWVLGIESRSQTKSKISLLLSLGPEFEIFIVIIIPSYTEIFNFSYNHILEWQKKLWMNDLLIVRRTEVFSTWRLVLPSVVGLEYILGKSHSSLHITREPCLPSATYSMACTCRVYFLWKHCSFIYSAKFSVL